MFQCCFQRTMFHAKELMVKLCAHTHIQIIKYKSQKTYSYKTCKYTEKKI